MLTSNFSATVGDDQVTASGGPGFTAPLPYPVGLLGQEGNDVLEGTPGADWLHGGPGSDVLAGRDGADTLDGAEGDEDYVDIGNGASSFADLGAGAITSGGVTD